MKDRAEQQTLATLGVPLMRSYYRPPKIYAQTQALRRRDALRSAERAARSERQYIVETVEQQGERMSDGGKELLSRLSQAFKKIAEAVGAR